MVVMRTVQRGSEQEFDKIPLLPPPWRRKIGNFAGSPLPSVEKHRTASLSDDSNSSWPNHSNGKSRIIHLMRRHRRLRDGHLDPQTHRPTVGRTKDAQRRLVNQSVPPLNPRQHAKWLDQRTSFERGTSAVRHGIATPRKQSSLIDVACRPNALRAPVATLRPGHGAPSR